MISLSGAFSLAVSVWAGGQKIDDPIEELVSIEERLLKVVPLAAAWMIEVTRTGYPALEEKVHHEALILEPDSWAEPSFSRKLPQWKLTYQKWEDLENRLQKSPFRWLKEHLPEIDNASIKTIDGESLEEEGKTVFRTLHEITLSGSARVAKLKAKLDWGSSGQAIVIARWELISVELWRSEKKAPLVAREVLAEAILDKRLLNDLRTCRQEVFMRASFENPLTLKTDGLSGFDLTAYDDITYEATEQGPALCVVDIDQDGFDDLFVMRRWGKNQLLLNQKNGSFREAAADYQLDFGGFCSCALFLDFDNDGDQDLFLGRSLEPSQMLENVNGQFRKLALKLPSLVTSAAAADYDLDGYLDLYVSTYFGRNDDWPERFLSPDDAKGFRSRAEGVNIIYDAAGAPNLLLKNLGGMRFKIASENEQVQAWRPTLQSTFADYDLDGDPDLLVTNDYSPDILYRNDETPSGQRRFVNVTQEMAPEVHRNYFGMGGSWGDYNNDGYLDLYLSAMFSKAGTRITQRLAQFDLKARQSTTGNLLLMGSESGRLTKVSGQEKGQLPVDRVGWSWGGQFWDPDNDGALDIYAPTGYYTPPDDLALIDDF